MVVEIGGKWKDSAGGYSRGASADPTLLYKPCLKQLDSKELFEKRQVKVWICCVAWNSEKKGYIIFGKSTFLEYEKVSLA